MEINFAVGEAKTKLTLNAFLRENGVTVALIKRLKFLPDGILVNGVKQNTDYILNSGDLVKLKVSDRPQQVEESSVIPQDIPLDIKYLDSCCMVVEKPYNMPSHPSFNHPKDTLANGFAGYWANKGEEKICRVINRLDKNTSGLVLIALDPFTAQSLKGGVDKTYFAIVKGQVQPCKGIIEAPIARQENSIITRCVSQSGQYAKTEYEVLKENPQLSLLKIKLHTGRTHQIRVHFSYIGHPLLGDELYGGESNLIPRHALHCGQLTFKSPANNQVITITSPLPADMEQLALKI